MPCPNAMLGATLPINRALSFHLKFEIAQPLKRTRPSTRACFSYRWPPAGAFDTTASELNRPFSLHLKF